MAHATLEDRGTTHLLDAESAGWGGHPRSAPADPDHPLRRPPPPPLPAPPAAPQPPPLRLGAAGVDRTRRARMVGLTGREVDALAHQAADDAVVAILRRLPEFRGESRFTTWAYRFAVLEVATKLSRHFWTGRGDL